MWRVLPSPRLREATTIVPVILVVVFQGPLIKVSAGTCAIVITYLSCGYPRFTTLAED